MKYWKQTFISVEVEDFKVSSYESDDVYFVSKDFERDNPL